MQDNGITGEVRVQDSRLKAHLHEHSVPLSCGVNTWLLKASKVIGPITLRCAAVDHAMRALRSARAASVA